MLHQFELPLLGLFTLMPILFGLVGRPKEGFWFTWALGICIIPTYIDWRPTTGVVLDARTGIALGGFLAMLITPRPGLRARWQWLDTIVVLHFLSLLATRFLTGSAGVMTPIHSLCFWLVPYAVGRIFFTTIDDIGRFAHVIAPLILVASVLGCVEMLIKKNPYNHLFSFYQVFQEIHGEMSRMGLRRAAGNVAMPISFGLVMTMVMPWSLVAARFPGRRPWHRFLPAINLAGAFCSLSRGPIAFCTLACAIAYFFHNPRRRQILGAIGIAGVVFVLFALQPILSASAEFIGDGVSTYVVINGRTEGVNSTRQRELMREAWAPVVSDAEFFGFGPEELLKLPARYKIPSALMSIESHYVYHQVVYGLMGIALFNLFSALVVYTLIRLAWRPVGPIEDFAGSLVGAQVAVLLSILSVYLGSECAVVWLFNAGLAANLVDLRRNQKNADRLRLAAIPPASPAPMRPL